LTTIPTLASYFLIIDGSRTIALPADAGQRVWLFLKTNAKFVENPTLLIFLLLALR